MGGKTNQAQRTKNNVRPSSSARSAELLASAHTSLVGFNVRADLGLVPIVTEQATDAAESKVSADVQLILRKLSKKDPITKQKALRELIAHINEAEAADLKPMLPFWPKHYQNLAMDTEHSIRELAQLVLQLLMAKCKRSMAPILKQIVPILLATQFDAYLPAATLASSTFNNTFTVEQRRLEVCLHCQEEIVTFCDQNLLFNTPDTLSSNSTLTAEEAKQKYERLVVASLKALTFFIKQLKNHTLTKDLLAHLQIIFQHAKFMSYAKKKCLISSEYTYLLKETMIYSYYGLFPRAAWFEVIEQILHHKQISELIEQQKTQLVEICVQNIDEQNSLVMPHVWSCFFMLQRDTNW